MRFLRSPEVLLNHIKVRLSSDICFLELNETAGLAAYCIRETDEQDDVAEDADVEQREFRAGACDRVGGKVMGTVQREGNERIRSLGCRGGFVNQRRQIGGGRCVQVSLDDDVDFAPEVPECGIEMGVCGNTEGKDVGKKGIKVAKETHGGMGSHLGRTCTLIVR